MHSPDAKRLVIAVDGPAGSGKSSASRLLAERLSYRYIDTGAMYRAAAVAAHRSGVSVDNDAALKRLMEGVDISFVSGRIHLDGEDVSRAIREPKMDGLSSAVSARAPIRAALITLQRRMAEAGGVVMEGRDIGTVVLPDADIKFFITASAEVRGKRRYTERIGRGEEADLQEVICAIKQRDERDARRELSPLVPADDAEVIDTSPMNLEEVVDYMMERVKKHGI
ncbi:MAG: (d)CMP kinase [Deltaproteobacteria bacterium]|nr:(d)CMP kinase [Candidatus Zymogenaceae bacterium]